MVDMDKHACCQLAENVFKNGKWPEDYITWEFLANHPRAMESGYFHINWNTIPGLYNRKSYLRLSLGITGSLLTIRTTSTGLWGLAVPWTPFHDCLEPGQKKEYVVLVAVV